MDSRVIIRGVLEQMASWKTGKFVIYGKPEIMICEIDVCPVWVDRMEFFL